MASAPILDIPFRQSMPLELSSAVKQYISTKYDQHPDMFAADLAAIDQLRNDAIHVQEPHQSGIRKLAEYAAQLQWISGKFPIDIGADFIWYPALGYNTNKPMTQNNLQFERANILCNLAALYSQLGTSLRSDISASGLKAACNYYCASAGVLKYLHQSVIPELRSTPPEDMDAMTLACLEQLMLAQAQECFWLKAVQDENKDSVIARLAASVSDYYDTAGEFGSKSSSIRSEWMHHMNAKHYHFAAAAQYRQAQDCLAKSKYGEEVARLKDSLDAANEALSYRRYLNQTIIGDLMGLKDKVTDVLKGAEKDNDMIYMCPVPPPASLPRISRASMVSARIPKEVSEGTSMLSDTGPYSAPLFAKLVPFAVHLAATIYVERRDRLVNNTIVDELENLTAKLHDLLQSLNLPGSLQALEKPLGLPPGILAHAEEVKQQGGVEKLLASIRDIDKLRANNLIMYGEAMKLLLTEAAEDEKLRQRHGTDRWTRNPSQIAAGKIAEQVAEYDRILKSAENTDKLVRGKLAENESMLRLLGGRTHELEEFVPNSSRATLTATMDREVGKLRQCINEVTRLESRRRRKIEVLRQKAKADDITTSILTEAGRLERENPLRKIESADFEPLFNSRLELRYNTDKLILQQESEEQEDLVSRLREANTSFLASRRMDSSLKEREDAIQAVENAFFKYKELITNLDVGLKFYNDLTRLLSRFRDECNHFVYGRRVEAGQMEVGITSSIHNMRMSTPVGGPTPPQIPATPVPVPSTPQPQPQTPLPAPRPTQPLPKPGLWQGDSSTPLRFGGPPPGR
ncbi:BRO1-like domain-containing protein [Sphaerosporella brunnea]|uniref:BRO1-like domain-containing protein n=1 Tax=Sphaerosporella brunnea TaxID=1250544 RepID=A0A5J5EYR8_9PEZI|nr:BRO1-like domain-containing protein [Sphaerosporella brunnea]